MHQATTLRLQGKRSRRAQSFNVAKTKIVIFFLSAFWLFSFVNHQSSLLSLHTPSHAEKWDPLSLASAAIVAQDPVGKGSRVPDQVDLLRAAAQTQLERHSKISIDIISVGSHARPIYQEAQERFFGPKDSVRNFFRITEEDDTEADCSSKLTTSQLEKVVTFCKSRSRVLGEEFFHLKQMATHYARVQWLNKKANAIGWLCAQKRPFDGLVKALGAYRAQGTPDYLLVLDDDSWVNIDQLEVSLPSMYPAKTPYAVAGCMLRSRVREHNFTFPYGGWGMIFSRSAIENLMKPLFCNNPTDRIEDEFLRLACWRLSENSIGEQKVFREGMSVAQLMHAYVTDQPYQQVDSWNSVGYCLHSDWVWGYFANFYHISVHANTPYFSQVLEDRLQGFNGSEIYTGRRTPANDQLRRECRNEGDDMCTKNSNICHYVTPQHMEKLAWQLSR
jgi:hypothetical protein|uniref:Uncharacterized protein n=1 Tax=Phaeodactylum tricornutum TaxID=2850 RepID=A0A8J9X684_PHATR